VKEISDKIIWLRYDKLKKKKVLNKNDSKNPKILNNYYGNNKLCIQTNNRTILTILTLFFMHVTDKNFCTTNLLMDSQKDYPFYKFRNF
jgi:hypothetical protein